ncbi:MAG TPA: thioesterase family protein [Candidatus Acidoferrales bacterium]|nr:thioesterase family protein [Candidatus Acidoferrales bacterium]
MLVNRKEIRIEWGDCDPGGIVFFPRYFEYCDACTNALFERASLPKPTLFKSYGIGGIPLVEVRARFIVPSQFGDTVTVESCVSEWGRSSFLVRHQIFKVDVLALEIFEKRVWVARLEGDVIRFKGQPIPQEVKDRFSRSISPA